MDFCGDFMDNSEKIIRKWLNRVRNPAVQGRTEEKTMIPTITSHKSISVLPSVLAP